MISNRVKKGKFDTKIPVRIMSNSSYGYYLVKIAITYNNNTYEIKEGEEYVVDSFLLKKIDVKIWEAIVKNNLNVLIKANSKID